MGIGRNRAELDVVARELAKEKASYLDQQVQLRKEAIAALHAAGHRVTFKEFRRWYEADANHASWVAAAVDSGVERGLSEPPETAERSYRRSPSVWMFTTFQLARIVYTVGDNRKRQGSDLADAHHISARPYYDVLVTEDRLLRDVVGLMPVGVRTCSSEEFAGELSHL